MKSGQPLRQAPNGASPENRRVTVTAMSRYPNPLTLMLVILFTPLAGVAQTVSLGLIGGIQGTFAESLPNCLHSEKCPRGLLKR